MAYENQTLRTKLGNMMTKLDSTISKVKSQAKKYVRSEEDLRRHNNKSLVAINNEEDF